MSKRVGIYSIGTFLPDHVRENSYWSPEIQLRWHERQVKSASRALESPEPQLNEGARRVVDAMREAARDPFQGAVTRRVMPDDMATSDMETAAARQAIERAGVNASEIGLVLTHSVCPDFLNTPNAGWIHKNLELDAKCISISLEGSMCNSFLLQLELAEQMILGGRVKYALLVQSSGLTRFAPREEIFSPWFGDGATAVIVGAVDDEHGVIGRSTRTDGSLNRALVFGVPDKAWYSEGRVVLYSEDPPASRRMLMSTADFGRQVVTEALNEAGLLPTDVDFYASHQANAWFRRVSQEYIGLDRAKSIDTFPWAGSLSGSNIPLVLATAERDGLLKDGDVVAMYSGGSGTTYSGVVLKWGMGIRERSIL